MFCLFLPRWPIIDDFRLTETQIWYFLIQGTHSLKYCLLIHNWQFNVFCPLKFENPSQNLGEILAWNDTNDWWIQRIKTAWITLDGRQQINGIMSVLPKANFAKIREMPTKMPTIFQINMDLLPSYFTWNADFSI